MDARTPETAIARMLGQQIPCPHCDYGNALKTDTDFERGHCDFCAMTAFRKPEAATPDVRQWMAKLSAFATPRTYRSEDEAYDEGIFDDD